MHYLITLIEIIIFVTLSIACYRLWKKKNDRDYLWLTVASSVLVISNIARYLTKEIYPASEQLDMYRADITIVVEILLLALIVKLGVKWIKEK